MAGLLNDDWRLHRLCQEGRLKKVEDCVKTLDKSTLQAKLANHKGVFGYTPLHEATANGHPAVLDFLLNQGGDVNCRANSGYTPLHLAASSGHVECVRVLLKHSADISMTDEFGKTPKQTAELSSKHGIVRLLKSEEVIKEVEKDGTRLNELLRGNPDLEPDCLTRALIAAVKRDSHLNIGKLVITGASNIDEALELAKTEKRHSARAILLLAKAAMTNDRNLVLKLFGEPGGQLQSGVDCSDDGFQEVQKIVAAGKVSTVVPIEVARRSDFSALREDLLLRTDVNVKEGTVYWHGLRLLTLDIAWLRKIHWVKKLRLARNGFKMLPNEMGAYLRQVTKLDLQYNELATIPRSIFELPSIAELNLASNKLAELPDLPEWSTSLTLLDLSHNKLKTIPGNPIAARISSLNLADNEFSVVPQCVCNFVTLQSLDLSDNKAIYTLPAQMGRLRDLEQLNLKGLNDLNDPPKNVQKNAKDCIIYLKSKLLSARGFYRMKLMLVGKQNRGKTTLVARLQGKEYGDESTVGVDVSEWEYKPTFGKRSFYFSIWDFGGQEEYYATHQCFLSERSLYLLLFNLKHGNEGVEELTPWLNNIALRAPDSCVLIVGTHLDEIADNERAGVDHLLQCVADIANKYRNKLQIKEVLAVGLKNKLENIPLLKDAIYNAAQEYLVKGQPVMGQMIPTSYHQLDKLITDIQKEVRNENREPIMHKEDFKTLVLQLGLSDIQEEDELKTATLFLNNVGTLLHYDDRSHNLDELYFVDPRWLCDMMAKIVTIRERNPYVVDGILNTKNLSFILRDERFPLKYFEQYLTLLDRFEIALALDSRRILIPSMLSEQRPQNIDVKEVNGVPLCARYIVFQSVSTPPGFWSRLISRIIHTIPQVRYALETHTEEEDGDLVTLPQSSVDNIAGDQPLISAPMSEMTFSTDPMIEIPNFLRSVPQNVLQEVDLTQVRLQYWRQGLFYEDPQLLFRVESLSYTNKKEGVLIVASANSVGKKTVALLVDLTMALINDWYPGMTDKGHYGGGIDQVVPCYECVKLKRSEPYQFSVQQCAKLISQGALSMECGYNKEEVAKNHTLSLADVVPDLLLQDIDPEFILGIKDMEYKEEDSAVLGQGAFGKVYRGKCKGKSVAIKKYQTSSTGHSSDDAFGELRKEATLLQKSHHPCLVCLVGVCVHPTMALVLEEAPLGSLEKPLIKNRLAIHRVVIHRIACEVAAALRFLHNSGIIFRDLKAANVLLWSLDPESLCHCKVTDFGIATHLAPIGARGLHGTKGFIAPEVLHLGKKRERAVYTNQADVFSFGMLLYQMITRRHPYHDIPAVKIDPAVDLGERPKFQDIPFAETAYFYLTRLMQQCWHATSNHRPTTKEIIEKVSMASFQAIMTVQPVRSKLSLRLACAVTSVNLTELTGTHRDSELWICCDGDDGTEISTYLPSTMVKTGKNFIKDNQVQHICLCGEHMWIASRAGIESGTIGIYSVTSRELVHSVNLRDYSVTCMTCSEQMVYCGTFEGFCFAFHRDIKLIKSSRPMHREISDYPIDGVLATADSLWVSQTNFIHFLNLSTLEVQSVHKPSSAPVGQLKLSGGTVWSAHLLHCSTVFSAWDIAQKNHVADIDVKKCMKDFHQSGSEDLGITAMTPALDTVWIGMSTGHILVFSMDKLLLMWFHPYNEYVRFLVCMPCEGPCRTEKAMVVSGGKGFNLVLVPDLPDYEKTEEKGVQVDKAGTLIIWEAFPSKMCQQISLIQARSSSYLDNHHTVKQAILDGVFKDGTWLLRDRDEGSNTKVTTTEPISIEPDLGIDTLNITQPEVSTTITIVNGKRTDGFDTLLNTTQQTGLTTGIDILPSLPEEASEPVLLKTHFSSTVTDTADVTLPDGVTVVRVSCAKPAQLQNILGQLETSSNLTAVAEKYQIMYWLGEGVNYHHQVINTQGDLENYLLADKRPGLFLVSKSAVV